MHTAAWLTSTLRRLWGPVTLPHAVGPGDLDLARPSITALWRAYGLRRRRRRLLFRAFRKRRQLTAARDRTAAIQKGDILVFATMRNEAERLPFFLAHHRRLGVNHFLIVDNSSTDGTREYLSAQPDVSLWVTGAGYKQARFGMDWLTWLLMRHGHGHWCLTLDADEALIYPHWESRDLRALTAWLSANDMPSFGTLMLDLYPHGRLSAQDYPPGSDPTEVLQWYDSGNYSLQVQPRMRNLWIQGGPRARHFFASDPRRAPTLNKVPLVRWHWRYAYVNSTHALLPPRLNQVYAEDGGERISGVLLHSKFLNSIARKSAEERDRRQHFANSGLYDDYYAALIDDPDLWCTTSSRYTGWRGLVAQGLMSRGGWR